MATTGATRAQQAIEVRWRASLADGVAHAYPVRIRIGGALCGAKRQDERFDHPRQSKCAECVAAAQA